MYGEAGHLNMTWQPKRLDDSDSCELQILRLKILAYMQRGKLRQLIHLGKAFFVPFDDTNAFIMRAAMNTA